MLSPYLHISSTTPHPTEIYMCSMFKEPEIKVSIHFWTQVSFPKDQRFVKWQIFCSKGLNSILTVGSLSIVNCPELLWPRVCQIAIIWSSHSTLVTEPNCKNSQIPCKFNGWESFPVSSSDILVAGDGELIDISDNNLTPAHPACLSNFLRWSSIVFFLSPFHFTLETCRAKRRVMRGSWRWPVVQGAFNPQH